ncbi:DUF5666 domain-containing protein [Roseateles oligotrophus]|uniref:DUF5666 domain-containing protein n=1 Tax=Roseateles oligotrophus TaxID=1769250 RepID=A0ABT2YMD5_9BURK|nr:DUF5666 domain-containing protein [Roseateles oligotrophus]MCV2371211.1 DUF5666 domain-containing protein [Roseateles oligotrophus]
MNKQSMRSWQQGLGLAICALSAATLVACGGGGGSSATPEVAPAAPPPTATITSTLTLIEGTITGFGSVVIDGVRYKDDGTKVEIGDNPELKKLATLGDLRTGMRVQGELKDGVLQNLLVNFALVGTVSAVDPAAGTISVFGQTIKITSAGQLPTVFDGFSNLSQLLVGDLIKVAGSVAADGGITATRIERKLKEGGELYRLSGPVQTLDATAKRFALGGNSSVTVDYAKAKVLPEGAVIENGKLVSVVANAAPVQSGGQTLLTASAVEVKSRQIPDAKELSIGGQINDFKSLASLRIGDVQVDASSAELKEGTVLADLVNGAQAYAKGSLTAGVLKAASLKVFKPETALKAMLIGQVTDFVSIANFKLRGTDVDASQANFSKGKAADLATGAWVSISGQLTASGVLAKTVEILPPPADKPARLEGAISGVDLATKRFSLLGTTVQWSDTTKLNPSNISLANLANGVVLVVEGSYSEASGVFSATGVKLINTTGVVKTVGFSGIAFEVTTTGFKVGSNTVLLGKDIKFEPTGTTLADLKNGARVGVKATLINVDGKATLTATQIEVQKPEKDSEGAEYVYLSGLIADFVSSADFKIGSQKVDASGSGVEFIDGDAAKLANGLKIEIKGSVSKAGVLIAKRVHFMPG